jgi:hypothetical protein
MPVNDQVPDEAPVLWLATRKAEVNGSTCREYHVTDERGSVLLRARAFVWRRAVVVTTPDDSPSFFIIRSRVFVLTGRAEVKESLTNRLLGIVSRNGTFRDAAGAVRGRFRDARSFSQRAQETVFQGAIEVLLQAADESISSGPHSFVVLTTANTVCGTLSYGILPFPHPAAAAVPTGSASPRPWHRLVPRLLIDRWHSMSAPRGWRFVRLDSDDDPRLEIDAAIFAAELSRW